MKRTLSLLLLAILCLSPLCACHTPENPPAPQDGIDILEGEFDYATSDLSTYLDLPESIFSALTISVSDIPEITDATVDAEFNSYFTEGGYYVPKANDDTVDTGDLLYLDYHGVLLSELERAAHDGIIPDVECTGMSYTEILAKDLGFAGGTSQQLSSLAIGSGQFIAGFEEGLVGYSISASGEENPVRLHLSFPSNYGSADLAGKEVIFFCRLAYIGDKAGGTLSRATVSVELLNRILGLSGESAYPSLEDCLDTIRMGLERSRENTLYNEKANAIYIALAERATFHALPDAALSLCVRDFLDRELEDLNYLYENDISYYTYLFGAEAPNDALVAAYYGYSRDNYMAEMKKDCIPSVKAELCYYTLLRHYSVTLSSEEYEAARKRYTDLYGEHVFDGLSAAEIRDQFLRDKITEGLIAYLEENGRIEYKTTTA